jgi:hypothetical protein
VNVIVIVVVTMVPGDPVGITNSPMPTFGMESVEEWLSSQACHHEVQETNRHIGQV